MVIRIELTAADLTPEVLNALQTLVPAENRGAANASAVKEDASVPTAEASSIPTAPIVPVTTPPVSVVPIQPTPAPAPAAPTDPAPAVPVTTAPTHTLDQIAKAGASLVDTGKMEQLLALLEKFGVRAITQLSSEQYGAFATELRALGAQI